MEKLRLFLFPTSKKRQSMGKLKENLETPRIHPLSLNKAVSFLLPIIVSLRHDGSGSWGDRWEQLPKEKQWVPPKSHFQNELNSCVIRNHIITQEVNNFVGRAQVNSLRWTSFPWPQIYLVMVMNAFHILSRSRKISSHNEFPLIQMPGLFQRRHKMVVSPLPSFHASLIHPTPGAQQDPPEHGDKRIQYLVRALREEAQYSHLFIHFLPWGGERKHWRVAPRNWVPPEV